MRPLYAQPKFHMIADTGLLVEYGADIDPLINRKVQAVKFALEKEPLVGIIEVVPAYCSVLVVYDPLTANYDDLKSEISDLDSHLTQIKVPEPETVEVPVCYGGEYGPDLNRLAARSGLSEDEVIQLHSDPIYTVYMLGFTPGFPFLGGLPEKLHTPRLDSPRTSVPAGSVGIANNQTGIYPIQSPGGWRLIGRTSLKLFDPGRKKSFLLKSGDHLKFKPIHSQEFNRLREEDSDEAFA